MPGDAGRVLRLGGTAYAKAREPPGAGGWAGLGWLEVRVRDGRKAGGQPVLRALGAGGGEGRQWLGSQVPLSGRCEWP